MRVLGEILKVVQRFWRRFLERERECEGLRFRERREKKKEKDVRVLEWRVMMSEMRR